jgi:hypothetical protein
MRRFETRFLLWRKRPRGEGGDALQSRASNLFRRFFDLIERLERPVSGLETKSEPPRKARVTRLDADAERKP